MSGELLREIRDFCQESGISESYFGKLVRVSEIVPRLAAGGTVTLRTADRVRAVIKQRRAREVPPTP